MYKPKKVKDQALELVYQQGVIKIIFYFQEVYHLYFMITYDHMVSLKNPYNENEYE